MKKLIILLVVVLLLTAGIMTKVVPITLWVTLVGVLAISIRSAYKRTDGVKILSFYTLIFVANILISGTNNTSCLQSIIPCAFLGILASVFACDDFSRIFADSEDDIPVAFNLFFGAMAGAPASFAFVNTGIEKNIAYFGMLATILALTYAIAWLIPFRAKASEPQPESEPTNPE